MLNFNVTVQATGPLLTDPQALTQFDTEVQRTLADIGAYGQRVIVQGSPRGVSAGGGGLRGSIFTELRGVPAHRQQIVASTLFYAPIVEVGRRPGKRPPAAPILLWVTRKLGVPTAQAARVAFLVARKIGRVGYAGAHMFERGAAQVQPYAQARFEELGERLRRIISGG